MKSNTQQSEVELIEIDLDSETEKKEDTVKVEESIIPKKESRVNKVVKEVISYAIIILLAFIIAIVVNNYVIINANVPTKSMADTINEKDKLFGYRLAYMFSEPKRGDVVIFEHQCYKESKKEALIKRVIGLPTDRIEIIDGVLYRNGTAVVENYITEPMTEDFGPYVVPEGCYFLLGDNRNISDDARFWDYPYVKEEDIIAKAMFKYSPSFEIIK